MSEIFTYGRFEVDPQNEEAFLEAWSQMATWASTLPGSRTFRLVRDVRNTGRFISLGQWDGPEAVRAFKSDPGFKERLAGMVKQAKEFEPTAQAIRNWVAQAGRDDGTREDGLKTEDRDEINRLGREVRQLKVERDILSKAAAWFARETDVIPPKGSDS